MTVAAYSKFQCFVGDLGGKVHNLDTDTLKIYLSNAAPSATHTVKTDIAEIATGSGYAGPIDIAGVWAQTGGVGTLTATGTVITAAGGSIGPFRYVILYNATAGTLPLIAWWDYGSPVTIADTGSFTVAVGVSIFTIT